MMLEKYLPDLVARARSTGQPQSASFRVGVGDETVWVKIQATPESDRWVCQSCATVNANPASDCAKCGSYGPSRRAEIVANENDTDSDEDGSGT